MAEEKSERKEMKGLFMVGWWGGERRVLAGCLESLRMQETSRSRRKSRVELWPITKGKCKSLPEREDGGEGMEVKVWGEEKKRKTGRLERRRRTQTGEKVGRRGAASAPESMRLDDGRSEETTSYFDGVAVFWMLEHGDMQTHWESCGSTSQSRHKHTLWMHKQTETHSLSFKLLFCNWWLLGICW